MEIKTIGIVGAGFMGTGIAYSATLAGIKVLLKDVNLELAEKGKQKIESIYQRQIEKGKMEEKQMERGLALLEVIDSYDSLNVVEFVIEAVSEDVQLKKRVFEKLDQVCDERCILASNTSTISITMLASATTRPHKFIGMHFFSPAHVMKLVEVTPGMETTEKTVSATLELAKKMGKEPIRLKECVGFAVNRMLEAFLREAIRLYEEGIASCEDIDKAVKLGLGHPMGPFELMDMIGNDIQLEGAKIMFAEYGERFRPSSLLRKMVDAGRLGKKVGRGWYDYPEK